MKKIHNIKLEYDFCDSVCIGEKPFEIRNNDREYQKGDKIRFQAVRNGLEAHHPINQKIYDITYVLSGWGLQDGYVALGIREREIYQPVY